MDSPFGFLSCPLPYPQAYRSLNMPAPSLDQIATSLSQVLLKMVTCNQNNTAVESLFHSKKVPGISIEGYLRRQATYSRCSPETFLLALIYIDRYLENNPEQSLGARNVHKLFFVSLVVAAKFNDDLKLSNADFAKLGGVDKYDLCLLETQFLRSITFRVHVSSGEFASYVKSVVGFGE